MELNPADLGRVDVRLKINAAGQVSAHLNFDDPMTAANFSARESDLRAELSKAGLSLGDDAISFSSRPPAADSIAAATQPQNQSQPQSQPQPLGSDGAFTGTGTGNANGQTASGDHQRGQPSSGSPQTPQQARALSSADALAQAADLAAWSDASNAYSSSHRLSLNLLV